MGLDVGDVANVGGAVGGGWANRRGDVTGFVRATASGFNRPVGPRRLTLGSSELNLTPVARPGREPAQQRLVEDGEC